MKQMIANKIYDNMISQVDSVGHHYQVLTEVTDHKRYYRAITKVDGFIESSNGNLHRNKKTHI